MKYKRQAQLAKEARALSAALAVAKLAGWSFNRLVGMLPRTFAGCAYESRCELMLIPFAVDQQGHRIEESIRSVRCDALIVHAASDSKAAIHVASLALWAAHDIRWYSPCRFWQDGDGSLWLATDNFAEGWGPFVELHTTRLRSVDTAPWPSEAEREAGFVRATDAIARLTGEFDA